MVKACHTSSETSYQAAIEQNTNTMLIVVTMFWFIKQRCCVLAMMFELPLLKFPFCERDISKDM